VCSVDCLLVDLKCFDIKSSTKSSFLFISNILKLVIYRVTYFSLFQLDNDDDDADDEDDDGDDDNDDDDNDDDDDDDGGDDFDDDDDDDDNDDDDNNDNIVRSYL